jgi:hypothetical protein
MTHQDKSRYYQPQDGGGEPDSPCRRMRDALPTHSDPNNVEIPVAPAAQAPAGPNMSPDANKDQIDDSRCQEKEREEELQSMMGRYAQWRTSPGNVVWQNKRHGEGYHQEEREKRGDTKG